MATFLYKLLAQVQPGSSSGSPTLASTSNDLADSSAATSPADSATYQEVLISNYISTIFHKSFVLLGWNPRAYSSGNEYSMFGGGAWKSTSAINRITIFPSAGNFIAGSRLTIYGLL